VSHYSQKTNYADYLHLQSLLSVQKPLSEHPDELHFIIVHQIHELWFKLAIDHIERARHAMEEDHLLEASRLFDQVIQIFQNLQNTTEHLHSLAPVSFHEFRELLAPGSGMQSFQFREIEFMLGLRASEHVEWVHRQLAKASHWKRVHKRLDEPSIEEVFMQVMERHQIPDIATIYQYPHDYDKLYLLAEKLSQLDHGIIRWRQSHIQLVERTIGPGVMGTGGTTHEYLIRTLLKPVFPALWEARNILTKRVGLG
jgi:tryptophan 2,3-dioxygenase